MDSSAYRRLADDLRAVQQGVQQGMAEIRATADSPDGLITATVGGRGELLDLEPNPRVYRDSAAVGRQCVQDYVLADRTGAGAFGG
ncbi:YbaB/EbfC family nucleoid-associated protein [Saccharothrix deserti]|uniref:YbaB/EbfC family nucleoid-associated protein n=1 Tax=Saccharothrix deserti TaxID=2593674 RepID=UPI00131C24FF|nr:YbaB/EbfC family nucleoid-associated protein [Saccharothrix deserti]